MSNTKLNLTTPVGRMIGGSLYEPKTTDSKGQKLVFKSGASAGQPRFEFSLGVAFPKTPGATHFSQESWLTPVWNLAHAAFPQGQAQHRDFSWKITDGDSTEVNKKGKRPCDQEGYAGHWVIWFTDASKAPRVANANGSAFLIEPGAVKPGDYVQVLAVVDDNKPSESPGLYWQPTIVALNKKGVEIVFGPSLAEAGFGNAPLPANAQLAPVGMMAPLPNVPGAAPLPPSSIPALPTVLAPPAPVSAAPARVMTAKAAGQPYEAFTSRGWTDAALIEQGYMMGAPPIPLAAPVGSAPMPPGPAQTAPAPIPVLPNPAFVQMPPKPARTMTALAGGHTYESIMASNQGWTDALLVQQGYMLP